MVALLTSDVNRKNNIQKAGSQLKQYIIRHTWVVT